MKSGTHEVRGAKYTARNRLLASRMPAAPHCPLRLALSQQQQACWLCPFPLSRRHRVERFAKCRPAMPVLRDTPRPTRCLHRHPWEEHQASAPGSTAAYCRTECLQVAAIHGILAGLAARCPFNHVSPALPGHALWPAGWPALSSRDQLASGEPAERGVHGMARFMPAPHAASLASASPADQEYTERWVPPPQGCGGQPSPAQSAHPTGGQPCEFAPQHPFVLCNKACYVQGLVHSSLPGAGHCGMLHMCCRS